MCAALPCERETGPACGMVRECGDLCIGLGVTGTSWVARAVLRNRET
jgi:hypothetical protein